MALLLRLFALPYSLDDAVNNRYQEEEGENHKPQRGDERNGLLAVDAVAKVDFLDDAVEAKKRRVFPGLFVVEGGVGDDGADDRGFFVGVDFFATKDRVDAESVFGLDVDVAGVDDERAGLDGLIKDDAGDVVFYDVAFFAGLSINRTI